MRILFVFTFLIIHTTWGLSQVIQEPDPSAIMEEKTRILGEAEIFWALKAAAQDEYILDSVITYTIISETDSVLSAKQEYIYTEDWKQERIYYTWDEMEDAWVPDLHYILIWDDDGNLIEYTRQFWDALLPGWVNWYRLTFEYNSAGQETFFLYLKWDEGLGDWENYIMDDYVYDAQGEMISLLSWIWDEDAGDWVGSNGNEWVYDGAGLLQEQTLFTWDEDAGDWWSSNRSEYTYDTGGLLVLKDGFDHSEITGLWIHNKKAEYYNNDQGLPDSLYQYHSVTNGTTWDPSSRTVMTYDNSGNMTMTVSSNWNSGAQSWEDNSKSEIGWDEYGHRVLDKLFVWDDLLPGWQLMTMTERLYNAAGDLLMYASFSYNSEVGEVIGVDKMIYLLHPAGYILFRNDYLWDPGLSDWYLDGRGFYYYTVYTVIAKNTEPSFKIFPNPVITELCVRVRGDSGVTYGIYTLNGREAGHGTAYGKEFAIDVADLPEGTYLIRVQQGEVRSSKLFIKNR